MGAVDLAGRNPATLALLVLVLVVVPPAEAAYPEPVGFVNDFADVLSEEWERTMEGALQEYENTTGREVAVVTVASLEGQEVAAYARALATEWGVGKDGQDNGVIVLVAPNDRRATVQVADGVAANLTSSEAQAIVDDAMLPRFRSQDYAGGLAAAVERVTRELDAPPQAPVPNGGGVDLRWSEGTQSNFAFGAMVAIGALLAILAGRGVLRYVQEGKDARHDLTLRVRAVDASAKRLADAWAIARRAASRHHRDVWHDALTKARGDIAPGDVHRYKVRADAASRRWFNHRGIARAAREGSALSADLRKREAVLHEPARYVNRVAEAAQASVDRTVERLESARKRLAHKDVKPATRRRLEARLEDIETLARDVARRIAVPVIDRSPTEWRELAATTTALQQALDHCTDEADAEVDEAEARRHMEREAKTKGPPLLAEVTARVKELEASAKSARARDEVAAAKRKLEEANESRHMHGTDWVVIYALLLTAQAHCASAASADAPARVANTTDGGTFGGGRSGGGGSSSYDSDSSSSYGGGFGGFGGGGGFGGTGGSGGW